VERDKPNKSESVAQTLLQLPWKQKRGDLKNCWIPFIKLGISTVVCGSFWGLKKFKMAAVAMVTKLQKMLNGNRTADPFET
jgi:hypothetical protein